MWQGVLAESFGICVDKQNLPILVFVVNKLQLLINAIAEESRKNFEITRE